MTHPTQTLVTCCGDRAPIDVEMVPICQALWAAGVHTQICCQGDDHDPAVLGFENIADADQFARFALDHGIAPVDAADWRWTLTPRFPLATYASVSVEIPHAQLAMLSAAFTGAVRVDIRRGEYVQLPGSRLSDPDPMPQPKPRRVFRRRFVAA